MVFKPGPRYVATGLKINHEAVLTPEDEIIVEIVSSYLSASDMSSQFIKFTQNACNIRLPKT